MISLYHSRQVLRFPRRLFCHTFSTRPPLQFQIWGSNTDVGKTVFSCGLLASRTSPSLYLKPVQTGYPCDNDVSRVQNYAHQATAMVLHSYGEPVSPDIAAEIEDRVVSDETLLDETKYHLNDFAHQNSTSDRQTMALVETAGGALSPCPSGATQADVYRPLRLPAILVGDNKLGGISATLAAYEALKTRGFSIPAVIMFAHESGKLFNEKSVAKHVDGESEVFIAPQLPLPEVSLSSYFESDEVRAFFEQLGSYLEDNQQSRFKSLLNMQKEAKEVFWYPFTQHSELGEVTCIDSAHGDHFTCVNESGYYELVDGVGSWWTNGVGHGNGKAARALAAAAGRYGHVMFPEAVYEPVFELSKRLLEGVGAGWASRVFYTDNGSTAVEVALKMAFRKRRRSVPERKDLPVKIVGLRGSYHGDTLGVMDCSEESDYNRTQTPWYEPRGLFLDPPTVSIKNGVWVLDMPNWIDDAPETVFESRKEVLASHRTMSAYNAAIRQRLDSVLLKNEYDLGAVVIEPLMLGAGGMKLVDPAFQRSLVSECRKSAIPVVFDEIFTGLWRLGCESGSSVLDCKPDVAAFGKLLTGGTIPLAATLASDEVFKAFQGTSKRDALLHGHSYTAHAAGCAVGVESLKQYEFLRTAFNGALHDYWSESHAREISTYANVEGVTCIGTVLAVELRSSEKGYASSGAKAVVEDLKRAGVFARPLGNVVYVMCTPVSQKQMCAKILNLVMAALESTTGGGAVITSQIGAT